MPKRTDLDKVMVIGSGPIIIGQAAEFDYSGSQACRALQEEGLEIVLVNSNPATIMTDHNMADRVYIEPLTVESIIKILRQERLGFKIIATTGTAQALRAEGLEVDQINKLSQGSPHVIDMIKDDKIDLVINTLIKGKIPARDGFQIRRNAVEMGIPCLTSLDTTTSILHVL